MCNNSGDCPYTCDTVLVRHFLYWLVQKLVDNLLKLKPSKLGKNLRSLLYTRLYRLEKALAQGEVDKVYINKEVFFEKNKKPPFLCTHFVLGNFVSERKCIEEDIEQKPSLYSLYTNSSYLQLSFIFKTILISVEFTIAIDTFVCPSVRPPICGLWWIHSLKFDKNIVSSCI